MIYDTKKITGRYVTYEKLLPFLKEIERYKVGEGRSVQDKPIPLYRFGNGSLKICIWSQMHGNEATTTLALIDFLAFLLEKEGNILEKSTLYVIPMLNPDGSEAYTRVNANGVDLNRDASLLTQPESIFLDDIISKIQPDFCLNLHGQRTIFSAGNRDNPATISFLAPAENEEKSITETRKKAMTIISEVNTYLQDLIPNHIGRYDDTFNINCTGDKFTSLKIPTILFEAGHYPKDYAREKVRFYIFKSMCFCVNYICNKSMFSNYLGYFSIPENRKLFFDVFVLNDFVLDMNIGVNFIETLSDDEIIFIPKVEETGRLKGFYGHFYLKLSDFYKRDFYNLDTIKSDTLKYISENIENIIS